MLLFVFRTDCWMQRWQSTVGYPLFEPWIQTGFSSADRNALLACAEDLSLSLYQQECSCSLKPTTNTWQVCCTAEYLLCKSLCSGLLHHTLWLILEGCSDAVLSFLGYSFTSFSFDLAFTFTLKLSKMCNLFADLIKYLLCFVGWRFQSIHKTRTSFKDKSKTT